MIHKDLQKYRDRLDEILAKAEPIFKLKDLILEIKEDMRCLDKDIESRVKNHPEMCDSCCPESDYCPQEVNGECPKIKRDVVSLFWGDNSMNTIKYLIGD